MTPEQLLALGTAWIHGRPATARRLTLAVGAAVVFAAGVMAVAPFTAQVPRERLAQGSDVFGVMPRVLAALGSGLGAVAIVAGALWSALRRVRPVANLLIAAGVLVAGASGLLNSVADEETAFAATLVAGIALIFAGYLVATAQSRPEPPGDHSR